MRRLLSGIMLCTLCATTAIAASSSGKDVANGIIMVCTVESGMDTTSKKPITPDQVARFQACVNRLTALAKSQGH